MQINANVSQRIEDWHSINWYEVNANIRNLRRQIFKATIEGELKRVRNLQKLMFRSFSNVLFSVLNYLNQKWTFGNKATGNHMLKFA